MLPVLCNAQTKEEKIQRKIDEAVAIYKYPIDARTHKISYEKRIDVPNASKELLFKRALQFVALQNYGRSENIRCKNNTNITTPIVDAELLINDPEDGKIVGNGFTHLTYRIRGEYRFVLTFKYRINVKDNSYLYEFTNFRVLEFLSAPKEKSRSTGYVGSTGFGAIATGSALRTFSDASLVQKDLEDFIIQGIWQNQNAGHNAFKEQLRLTFGDLKEVMTGDM